MKKKIVLALLMAALLAGGVSAQDKFFSVGGGITVAPSFSTAKDTVEGDTDLIRSFDFGVNVFVDVKYVELNVGLLFGSMKLSDISDSIKNGDNTGDATITTLTFGLLAKLPLSIIKNRFVIFPFIGADYSLRLSTIQDGTPIEFTGEMEADDYFNNLSILAGLGIDVGLIDAMYIRAEVGYGLVINSDTRNKATSLFDGDFGDNFKALFSNGKFPIKLAVGFRF
jgi:hypothetical protein